jgi:predicted MFS family arabinose efflux permease
MTGFLSWHWIFLINVPVGCLAVLIAWRALPAGQEKEARSNQIPFDIQGAVLSVVGLAALVYTLTAGSEGGWKSSLALPAILCLSALAAFIYRETKAPEPLLDLSLFRNRIFTRAILTTILALMLLTGGNFLLPFYLEIVQGLRPEQVGVVILIYSIVYMPVGLLSGKLSDRISPARICSVALFLAIFASLSFAFLLQKSGLVPSVVYLVILAVAYGFFFAPNNHLVMSLAPSHHEGVASGVYSTVMNVGMILGVCFFGGIFSLSLPAGLSVQHLDRGSTLTVLDPLICAFRNAFLAGAVVCCAAFALSLFTAPGKVPSQRP